ncbi:DNA-directed RNA polymerase [Candidatus Micrarchaeota archaeon CG_4_10_14_0_2_um_filter_60_11]|nr:MAG: DNA-directed RNA polymerase [Candidatus Micrarchaeota archaeon CG1_02_60_51]PIN95821.1 MAG: DNA-directed RNA polymerase [Candidatus Micrarchaeota archaeon CG10_big_fil_rev_8_21_14_0_10_60_32]PIO01939.1 MAG: DNA-directed RNA polymerase [Candidatus Micrarchaeota archaeon CG09_land_8_20_14_0_10_60_16]PIY91976.1 MAG: DNA-directed RNA polymerase [Candidatus Micrarchaeota archaeon CG_4_10_14_0_8_um_filter_60_7]PIZ91048.1 MAG: DNA-directed RNA polymerase [Candidatus Micrarchaeota archaeon CG_4
MYKLVTFKESVRVPPAKFGLKFKKAALEMLREQYERTLDKDHGIIISLHAADIKSPGRVIHGDGAAYFDVEFDALCFKPVVNEVVDGEVSEIVEFGAFVRLGPLDGLVHVSQIANDYLTYDKRTQALVGRQTKKTVMKGDFVRAKVATVSVKDSVLSTKVALTMRPDGLGKITPSVAQPKKVKHREKPAPETIANPDAPIPANEAAAQ